MTSPSVAPTPHTAPPSWDVVCVGLATWDTIVRVPRWPDPDGRLVVERLVRAPGGPAATAAAAAAASGARTAFVGALGDDEASDSIRSSFVASGVQLVPAGAQRGASAESVILSDSAAGTRSILHAEGARLARLDGAAAEAIADAAWVHADHAGYGAVSDVPASVLSVDAGNPIPSLALDGVGLYAPTGAALLERTDAPSVHAAILHALDEGARRVVVSLGEDGAIAADRSGAWVAAPVVVDVASTLGAGDVFHGWLVGSLAQGMTLPDAMHAANVAAALSCRAVDGRSGIPSRSDLEEHLSAVPPVEPIVLGGSA
jgi:sulfofructose kinase